MKTWLWMLTCVFTGLWVGMLIFAHSYDQTATHDNATLHRQQSEITQLEASIARISDSVNGNHRDLVTCTDLQQLSWNVNVSDQYDDSMSGYAGLGPITLPSHCINH